jgi:hypothetical protein
MPLRLLTLTVLASTTASLAGPSSLSISVYESAKVAKTTEGDTTLATDPETAFATVSDYARWPAIFSDLAGVKITERGTDDARVVVAHRDGSVAKLHFHNRPTTRTLWFEQLGGDAKVWAEISFSPDTRAGTTRVHSRVHADVSGFAGMFVSSGDLLEQRQRLLRTNLTELRAYFAQRH